MPLRMCDFCATLSAATHPPKRQKLAGSPQSSGGAKIPQGRTYELLRNSCVPLRGSAGKARRINRIAIDTFKLAPLT